MTELSALVKKGQGRNLPVGDGRHLMFYEQKRYPKREELHGIGKGGQRWGSGGVNWSEVEKKVKQQVCINGTVNIHTTCETREHPGGQL